MSDVRKDVQAFFNKWPWYDTFLGMTSTAAGTVKLECQKRVSSFIDRFLCLNSLEGDPHLDVLVATAITSGVVGENQFSSWPIGP